MTIAMGLDVGTTTLSAVGVDTATGEVVASATKANDAKATSAEDAARGRSEWDIEKMAALAAETVRACVDGLGGRKGEVAGLAVTGQQHGVVVVDGARKPLTSFINWQDRRGEEPYPCGGTWAENARAIVGEEAVERAGCRLATGYMGTTLWWLSENEQLPEGATACFGSEFIAARLGGVRPVTDPTMGASSGLFDLRARTWDEESIDRLGLAREIFPEVREAGDALGRLTKEAADATGLSEGLAVCVGLGDNQASFLGSVADLRETVLVNVGTGAQVACHADEVGHGPEVETRPFARSGYLLVHAMLSGGKAYALLEEFLRRVGSEVLGVEVSGELYEKMEALAEEVAAGCDGMRCDPSFAGSRWDAERRGAWGGVSETNLTPGHVIRALLEGMARSLKEGWERLEAAGAGEKAKLVGAGNGVRENGLLVRGIEAEFGKAMKVPAHKEEAAYGAALVAGYAAGVWESVEAAAKVVRYE